MSSVPSRELQMALLPEISNLPKPYITPRVSTRGKPIKRKPRKYVEPVLLEELARYLNHPYNELKRWAESWGVCRRTHVGQKVGEKKRVHWVSPQAAARLILVARIAQGAVWEWGDWEKHRAYREKRAEYVAEWKRKTGRVKAPLKRRKDHVPL